MDNQNQIETTEEKRKGNLWSLISLLCFVGRFVISIAIAGISGVMGALFSDSAKLSSITTSFSELMFTIGSCVSVLFAIAALVIIIYVRVKYPKNVFGKVLMWIYIVMFVIYIITMAVIIIACGIACSACIDDCEECGQMGMIIIERFMLC